MIGLGIFITIVVCFAVGLSSARLARKVGDRAARFVSWAKGIIGKAPVKWRGESFVRFRDETIGLIRRRWAFLTVATLAGHLTVFVVLLASVRAVGIPSTEVSIVEAFAAWALARVLGSIPLTPGGVGFVELGLTGALVAFGASNDEAVAATLIYRFLTVVPTLVFGLLAARRGTWAAGPEKLPRTRPDSSCKGPVKPRKTVWFRGYYGVLRRSRAAFSPVQERILRA